MGRVSEVHVKNMKSFPWMFFNDITEVQLDYNIGVKREDISWISYNILTSKDNDQLSKRYSALEAAVRALFWKEMEVRLSLNNEVFKNE